MKKWLAAIWGKLFGYRCPRCDGSGIWLGGFPLMCRLCEGSGSVRDLEDARALEAARLLGEETAELDIDPLAGEEFSMFVCTALHVVSELQRLREQDELKYKQIAKRLRRLGQ